MKQISKLLFSYLIISISSYCYADDECSWFKQDSTGKFHSAVCHGQFNEIKDFMEEGASLNAFSHVRDDSAHSSFEYYRQALHVALGWGYNKNDIGTEGIRYLIDKGADIHSPMIETYFIESKINALKYEESTPLMIATRWGELDIVELLVSRGANVNYKTKSVALFRKLPLCKGSAKVTINIKPDGLKFDDAVHCIMVVAKTAMDIANEHLGVSALDTSREKVSEFLIRSGANVEVLKNSGATPEIIETMLSAAKENNVSSVNAAIGSLVNLPKQARDNRKVAREKNKAGIVALNALDYKLAVSLFSEGVSADQSDVEIINNLGYSLMMDGQLDAAKTKLLGALGFDITRSGAWANLGEDFAKIGNSDNAEAAFKLSYYYSKAPEKTIEFFKSLSEKDADEKVRNASAKAVAAFPNIQPLVRP